MKLSPAVLAEKFGQMDLFKSIQVPILEQLAAQSTIEEFSVGAVVFHKNEPGRSLYLILSGAVKVHDGDYTVAQMPEGSCFGELALLDDGPRSMSVTATEPTTLAVIERDVLFAVFRNEPDVTRKIVGTLTQRLRHQTDRLLEQHRRREEELTRLVDERTAELMRQKEEAERLRAKAEAEKQEAEYQRQRAEQSELFEQQFLANMSHEIRTPMNAVLGMTNILLQKNPRADQLKYLDSIRHSSEALLVILNDILDISKIEAGRMELEHTDFSVAQIVEQVVNTLRFRAEEKALSFNANCDTTIPAVLIGDPVRLQQILLNLAGNAIKFTEKGSVHLSVRLLKKTGNACHLHFEVRDTGIGMTAEQVATVFERFRQASGDTTRRYGGTGLGLAISKQLVELFGGDIKVQSTHGEGSVFSFEINLETSANQTIQPKQEAVSSTQIASLKNLCILVAEDNPYNRVVAVETLELILPGVRVSTAENGEEAVRMVEKGEYDLVLMDVAMPVMDGLEATRRIRALPPPKNKIPVVAFTASVIQSEIQKCKAAGMNGYVPKPFKDSELMGALHAAVTTDSSDFDPPPSRPVPPSFEMEEPGQSSNKQSSLDFLEQLTGGNRERIRKYLGLYLESAQTSLPKIETALTANDGEGMRRAVHTLKPQFKIVGLAAASILAEQIEKNLLDGILPHSLSEETTRLLAEIRQSVGIFKNHLQQ